MKVIHKTVPLLLLVILIITMKVEGQVIQKSSDHVMFKPDDIKWADGPSSLPAGAKKAIIEGDPKDSGLFTMRLKLPANFKIMPHWLTAAEHVTVIEGSFYMGVGENFDEKAAMEIPTGGFVVMATGTRHFGFSKKECIIQVHGIGPWKITYVNANDDPRNKK